MIEYDKLIRDNIPEIIETSGKKCIVEVMDNDTYIQYLDQKLNEELADLLEVIYAVTEARGYSIKELEQIRIEKAEKRGGFNAVFTLFHMVTSKNSLKKEKVAM